MTDAIQFQELCRRASDAHRAGRLAEAERLYGEALAQRPDIPELLYNMALVLHAQKRRDEALARFDAALVLRPHYAEALTASAVLLGQMRRHSEALARLDLAIAALANHPRALAEALFHRGHALAALHRPGEALDSYDRAEAAGLRSAQLLIQRGHVRRALRHYESALADYHLALIAEPANAQAFAGVASMARALCDWPAADEVARQIGSRQFALQPFVLLGYSGDPALLHDCAVRYSQAPPAPPLQQGVPLRRDRIHIAYLSADFHNHATAMLMAGLFERHDRARFEITALSYGPDDGSAMRARVVKSFDHFLDARQLRDEDAARLLVERGMDIAVDLKGYTANARPLILSHRPCPVQVNYLGYPGTMGADYIDYILADAVVAPQDAQPFFSEKIVTLPHCYQANDFSRPIAPTPSRAGAGLPEQGFVFCAFNRHWKITEPMFDAWMRLLAAVPGSLLWLLEEEAGSRRNLCAAAAARGIDPARLIFAGKLPLEKHLARHRLADLFLDTTPCNAHTTASDALWAGLPLVTLCGQSFAGRVAASLLHAIRLPELVTAGLADYEALALALARDPARLAAVRQTLARNRDSAPLFDCARFTRGIEAAYQRMFEIAVSGQPPQAFAVGDC